LVFDDFSKIFPENSSSIKICPEQNRYFTGQEFLYTFVIISRSFLLRMRNVSDKSCTENQNIHFVSNIFFLENLAFYEIM